jgi:hypothetical protein
MGALSHLTDILRAILDNVRAALCLSWTSDNFQNFPLHSQFFFILLTIATIPRQASGTEKVASTTTHLLIQLTAALRNMAVLDEHIGGKLLVVRAAGPRAGCSVSRLLTRFHASPENIAFVDSGLLALLGDTIITFRSDRDVIMNVARVLRCVCEEELNVNG